MNNDHSSTEFLRRAAQRAAAHSFFVASDLADWQELRGLGEDALADFLGCPLEQLPRLALCRRPDPGSGDFRKDVERIAAHVAARPERLAQFLREVESVRALRRAGQRSGTTADRGMLLAARDRAATDAAEEPPVDNPALPRTAESNADDSTDRNSE